MRGIEFRSSASRMLGNGRACRKYSSDVRTSIAITNHGAAGRHSGGSERLECSCTALPRRVDPKSWRCRRPTEPYTSSTLRPPEERGDRNSNIWFDAIACRKHNLTRRAQGCRSKILAAALGSRPSKSRAPLLPPPQSLRAFPLPERRRAPPALSLCVALHRLGQSTSAVATARGRSRLRLARANRHVVVSAAGSRANLAVRRDSSWPR